MWLKGKTQLASFFIYFKDSVGGVFVVSGILRKEWEGCVLRTRSTSGFFLASLSLPYLSDSPSENVRSMGVATNESSLSYTVFVIIPGNIEPCAALTKTITPTLSAA